MFLYTVLAALVGIVAGLFLAIRTKKSESVTYQALDRIGKITNIVLAVAYTLVAPFYMFLGMISTCAQQGVMGVIGWAVCIVCASAALVCYSGLGASVALRKKGKRVPSFLVQFAGVISIGLTVLLYILFEGTLINPLN